MGAGRCPGLKNASDSVSVIGMIAAGPRTGLVDILSVVVFFEQQYFARMKAAVVRVFVLQADQKVFCMITKAFEGLPDWFQSIADLF